MPAIGPVMSTKPLWFTEGASNQKPTYPGPDWFNIIQDELMNVLASADIPMNKADNTQLSQAISKIVGSAIEQAADSLVPPVGQVLQFINTANPNLIYSGTTWVCLDGAYTLRTATPDGSNVFTDVGVDSVTLTTEHLPAHNHSIGGNTGNFSATEGVTGNGGGAKGTTGGGGSHYHNEGIALPGNMPTVYVTTSIPGQSQAIAAGGSQVPAAANTNTVNDHTHTFSVQNHTHTVSLPAHNHSLPSSTGNSGSGAEFNIVPKSKYVMTWYRQA